MAIKLAANIVIKFNNNITNNNTKTPDSESILEN